LTLIHHLATCLHPDKPNHVVAIHLADTSLDARSLLGSYISSPTNPGTFQWRDGVLVKAMKEGKFLVLETVDKASSEVLGTIWELVESLSMSKPIGAHAEMNVLGREKIRAKEGFALFATRSVSVTGGVTLPAPSFLGHHKWMRVDLCQPTQEDLLRILATKFARLTKGVVVSILGIWESLQKLDQLQAIPSARPYSIRDLMKWCKRIEHVLPASSDNMDVVMETTEGAFTLSNFIQNPIDREDVFLEARDIFFASLNPTKTQVKIKERAMLFADSLKIGSDRVDYLIQGRTAPPQLTKSQNGKIINVVIDRFTLDAFPSPLWTKQEALSRHFALHRLSLNLLAALAGCIQANESALLTGETGTGKTTAVTYLASLLSHPLVSLNLSQQTESSDLIGGWKPVEARGPAQALQERFMNLFNGTFSRERNVKYEEAIRTASAGGKWKRLVALWREAAKRAQDRIDQKKLPRFLPCI
jgi:midasin